MQDFLTVTQLNKYINRCMENDPLLQDCWLKGEISGLKLYQQSGHLYFSLKDQDSIVSCVMFKSRTKGLKFRAQDGQEVLVRGSLAVFQKQGRYQVYVQEMQPFGIGGLLLLLEQLKKDLETRGYFSTENKKDLPALANRIGIVTSQDGAALRDMVRILKQRHRRVDIVLAHASVQGAEAPQELAAGIALLNLYGQVDLIIIGRGGGSLEDLMAFNTETVVKAVYQSQIPVVSAVGHEIDFTLCDLAADLRAATPSQAAQLAVPDLSALEEGLEQAVVRMHRAVKRRRDYLDERLDRAVTRRIWRDPVMLVNPKRESLDSQEKLLHRAIQEQFKEQVLRFNMTTRALDNLSPLKIMGRGYAVVRRDGRLVKDGREIECGDSLTVSLSDSDLVVEVKDKEQMERWKK